MLCINTHLKKLSLSHLEDFKIICKNDIIANILICEEVRLHKYNAIIHSKKVLLYDSIGIINNINTNYIESLIIHEEGTHNVLRILTTPTTKFNNLKYLTLDTSNDVNIHLARYTDDL